MLALAPATTPAPAPAPIYSVTPTNQSAASMLLAAAIHTLQPHCRRTLARCPSYAEAPCARLVGAPDHSCAMNHEWFVPSCGRGPVQSRSWLHGTLSHTGGARRWATGTPPTGVQPPCGCPDPAKYCAGPRMQCAMHCMTCEALTMSSLMNKAPLQHGTPPPGATCDCALYAVAQQGACRPAARQRSRRSYWPDVLQ